MSSAEAGRLADEIGRQLEEPSSGLVQLVPHEWQMVIDALRSSQAGQDSGGPQDNGLLQKLLEHYQSSGFAQFIVPQDQGGAGQKCPHGNLWNVACTACGRAEPHKRPAASPATESAPAPGAVRQHFETWFKATEAGRDTTLKHALWTAWKMACLHSTPGQAAFIGSTVNNPNSWDADEGSGSDHGAPPMGWQPINTRPWVDDLMWFRRGQNIDGPQRASSDDADRYDYWAPCEPPPLAASPLPPEGRSGWKWVPEKPTREMLQAAIDESGWTAWAHPPEMENGVEVEQGISQEEADEINDSGREAMADTYAAMLAAAPDAGKGESEGGCG